VNLQSCPSNDYGDYVFRKIKTSGLPLGYDAKS